MFRYVEKEIKFYYEYVFVVKICLKNVKKVYKKKIYNDDENKICLYLF